MASSEKRLAGKVAIVTGAGSRADGIGNGRAASILLARHGARVTLIDSVREWAGRTHGMIAEEGGESMVLEADVTDSAACAAAVRQTVERWGRLDILVNNVGIRMREPLEAIGSADLRRMLDVDLVAAFALAKIAAPRMAQGGYGRIINMSSVAALRGRVGDAAYIIAKGAMNAMTRSLAAELGHFKITCNAIMPGGFLTEANENLKTPAAQQMFKTRMPLGRAGDPPEIAGPAVFLASPAASYVTGICLAVDGGALATS